MSSGLANVAVHVRFRGGLPKGKKLMGVNLRQHLALLGHPLPFESAARRRACPAPGFAMRTCVGLLLRQGPPTTPV